MANTILNKSFLPNESRDIRYLNRNFSQLRDSLISYSKTYFPNTYKDFSPSSPGMMFIEQAAYVGDVISFYTDYIFKEGVLSTAQERKNIINLARYLGYKVKAAHTSNGTLDIYQLCPATNDGNGNYYPDPTYMLQIGENSQFSSNNNSFFILTQEVDFSLNTPNSPLTSSIFSTNPDGTPDFFLLQKTGNIIGGQIYTTQVIVNAPVSNYSIQLDETNVLQILDIYDSNNNRWYEVDYIAQEVIPIQTNNTITNQFSDYRDTVPYILNYISTSRKFTTSVDENSITTLTFGSGTNSVGDQLVNLDSNLIGNGISNINSVNIPIDPSSFLNNDNYGVSPFNTTLTIRYLVGGGQISNCQSGNIINVVGVNYNNSSAGFTPDQVDLLNTVQNSLKVYNSQPCVGGTDSESNAEIQMNAAVFFGAQNRIVTGEDYLARIYSMPPQYGVISKAKVISNMNLNNSIQIQTGTLLQNTISFPDTLSRQFISTNTNPFSINLYALVYDSNRNLTTINPALAYNVMTYLQQFKMLTDEINIIDGYIINIGVDINISIFKGYNRQEVTLGCLNAAKSFFNIDNWSFSQPINLNQLQLQIANVNGVQSISSIDIYNNTSIDGNYSTVQYDISSATRNNIIYPSIDPSIFEVKFPNSDIRINIS